MGITLLDLSILAAILGAFVLGLRTGMATLIILRPLCDRLFELASFEIGGSKLTYGAVVNILVIAVAVINIPQIHRCMPPKLRYVWLPFLLVCSAAVLYSPAPIDALRKLTSYLSFSAMFFLAFASIKTDRDVWFFLKLIIFSSVTPVLYGLFQAISRIDLSYDRVESTFTSSGIFGFYLALVVGIILFLLADEHSPLQTRSRLILYLYLVPLLSIIVITDSRTAWTGCLSLFLVYGLVCDRRMLILVVTAPILALVIPQVSERIADLASRTEYVGGSAMSLNSFAWRELLWQESLRYLWDHQPILGNGLVSFNFYSPVFFPHVPEGTWAHNDYIKVLFETGFVGLFGFVWLFWRCLGWLIRNRHFGARGTTMAGALILMYLVCSFSDNLLDYLSFQWAFWFTFGVVCSRFAWQSLPVPGDARQRAAFALLTGSKVTALPPDTRRIY